MDQQEEVEATNPPPPPMGVSGRKPPPHRHHFNLLDGEIRFTFGMEQRKKNIIHVIGSNMIAYTSGNFITFHDLKHRQQISLEGRNKGFGALAVHPSGNFIALGERGVDPRVLILTFPELKLFQQLKMGTEEGYSVIQFDKKGDRLGTVGTFPDYMLTIWDWRNGTVLLKNKAFSQDIYTLRFSPFFSGKLITSGMGHIRFWKMESTFTGLKLKGDIGKFGAVELTDIIAFAELKDGQTISGSESGYLLSWEAGLLKAQYGRGPNTPCHDGACDSVQMDTYGKMIVTAGTDGCIRWWQRQDFEAEVTNLNVVQVITPVKEIRLPSAGIPPSPLPPTARINNPSVVAVPPALPGQPPAGFPTGSPLGVAGPPVPITALVPTMDRWLVTANNGRVYDLAYNTDMLTQQLDIPSDRITCVAIQGGTNGEWVASQHSGAAIAVSCEDGKVFVLDAIHRRPAAIRKFPSPATSVCWLPAEADEEGNKLVVGTDDGSIRIVQVIVPEQLAEVAPPDIAGEEEEERQYLLDRARHKRARQRAKDAEERMEEERERGEDNIGGAGEQDRNGGEAETDGIIEGLSARQIYNDRTKEEDLASLEKYIPLDIRKALKERIIVAPPKPTLDILCAFKPHVQTVTAMSFSPVRLPEIDSGRLVRILATGSADGTVFFFALPESAEEAGPIGFVRVSAPISSLAWPDLNPASDPASIQTPNGFEPENIQAAKEAEEMKKRSSMNQFDRFGRLNSVRTSLNDGEQDGEGEEGEGESEGEAEGEGEGDSEGEAEGEGESEGEAEGEGEEEEMLENGDGLFEFVQHTPPPPQPTFPIKLSEIPHSIYLVATCVDGSIHEIPVPPIVIRSITAETFILDPPENYIPPPIPPPANTGDGNTNNNNSTQQPQTEGNNYTSSSSPSEGEITTPQHSPQPSLTSSLSPSPVASPSPNQQEVPPTPSPYHSPSFTLVNKFPFETVINKILKYDEDRLREKLMEEHYNRLKQEEEANMNDLAVMLAEEVEEQEKQKEEAENAEAATKKKKKKKGKKEGEEGEEGEAKPENAENNNPPQTEREGDEDEEEEEEQQNKETGPRRTPQEEKLWEKAKGIVDGLIPKPIKKSEPTMLGCHVVDGGDDYGIVKVAVVGGTLSGGLYLFSGHLGEIADAEAKAAEEAEKARLERIEAAKQRGKKKNVASGGDGTAGGQNGESSSSSSSSSDAASNQNTSSSSSSSSSSSQSAASIAAVAGFFNVSQQIDMTGLPVIPPPRPSEITGVYRVPGLTCYAFSPGFVFLATGDEEGRVMIHAYRPSAIFPESVHPLLARIATIWGTHAHNTPVTSLSFHPGGRLVSGAADGTVLCFDLGRTLATHTREINMERRKEILNQSVQDTIEDAHEHNYSLPSYYHSTSSSSSSSSSGSQSEGEGEAEMPMGRLPGDDMPRRMGRGGRGRGGLFGVRRGKKRQVTLQELYDEHAGVAVPFVPPRDTLTTLDPVQPPSWHMLEYEPINVNVEDDEEAEEKEHKSSSSSSSSSSSHAHSTLPDSDISIPIGQAVPPPKPKKYSEDGEEIETDSDEDDDESDDDETEDDEDDYLYDDALIPSNQIGVPSDEGTSSSSSSSSSSSLVDSSASGLLSSSSSSDSSLPSAQSKSGRNPRAPTAEEVAAKNAYIRRLRVPLPCGNARWKKTQQALMDGLTQPDLPEDEEEPVEGTSSSSSSSSGEGENEEKPHPLADDGEGEGEGEGEEEEEEGNRHNNHNLPNEPSSSQKQPETTFISFLSPHVSTMAIPQILYTIQHPRRFDSVSDIPPTAFCLEEARRKEDEKLSKQEAEKRKQVTRMKIQQLREQLIQLQNKNRLTPASAQLPPEAFEADPHLRSILSKQNEAHLQQIRRAALNNTARASIGLRKVRERFFDNIEHQHFTVHGFRNGHSISSFRLVRLPPKVLERIQQLIARAQLHRARQQAAQRMMQMTGGAGGEGNEGTTSLTNSPQQQQQQQQPQGNVNNMNINMGGNTQQMSNEANNNNKSNNNAGAMDDTNMVHTPPQAIFHTPHPSMNVANTTAVMNPENTTMGKSNRITSSAERTRKRSTSRNATMHGKAAAAAKEKERERKKMERAAAWEQLTASKPRYPDPQRYGGLTLKHAPPPLIQGRYLEKTGLNIPPTDEELAAGAEMFEPEDQALIERTMNSIGEQKLKTEDDFVVPERERPNAEKKQRQILFHQYGVHGIQQRFNAFLLKLRDNKLALTRQIRRMAARIYAISRDTGEPVNIFVPSFDGTEWPERMMDVTDADIREYEQRLAIQREREEEAKKIASGGGVGLTAVPGKKKKKQADGGDSSHNNANSADKNAEGNKDKQSGNGGEEGKDDEEGDDDDDDDELRLVDPWDPSTITDPEQVDVQPFVRGMPITPLPDASSNQGIFPPPPEQIPVRISGLTLQQQISQQQTLGTNGTQMDIMRREYALSIAPSDLERAESHIRQVMLTGEQRRLKMLIGKLVRDFDAQLDDLRKSRFKITEEMKSADLRLMTLYEELVLLQEFEEEDSLLSAEFSKCKTETAELTKQMRWAHRKMEQKGNDLKNLQAKEREINEKFENLMKDYKGKENPFYTKMRMIFEHTIKKKNEDEDEDESDSSVSTIDENNVSEEQLKAAGAVQQNEDEDYDGSLPQGCDELMYERVKKLAEENLPNVQERQYLSQSVYDLADKTNVLLAKKNQAEKNLELSNKKIVAAQQRKQKRLNRLSTVIAVHSNQIKYLHRVPFNQLAQLPASSSSSSSSSSSPSTRYPSSSSSSSYADDLAYDEQTEVALRSDFSDAVVSTNAQINQLDESIRAAQASKAQHDRLTQERRLTLKQVAARLREEQDKLQKKQNDLRDVQILMFGQVVPPEDIMKWANQKPQEELASQVRKEESQLQQEYAEEQEKVQRLKLELADLMRVNTAALHKLADAVSEQQEIERSLDTAMQKVVADFPTLETKRRGTITSEQLAQKIVQNKEEIEALRQRHYALRRKGGSWHNS